MGTCLSFSLKDWSPAEKQGKKQLFIRLTWVQQNLWILANIIVAFERYFEWPIPASIISICSEQDRQGTRSWPATVRRCKKSIGPFLVSDSNLTLWHFDTFVASTASTFALIVFFSRWLCVLSSSHMLQLQHAPLSSMGVSYCVSPSSLHLHGTFKCDSGPRKCGPCHAKFWWRPLRLGRNGWWLSFPQPTQ